MPLLRLSDVSIAYGTHALLDQASFQLDAGERVGLLGRNGEGKSTLLKIIAGKVVADHGEVWRQPELKLAWLEQIPEFDEQLSVYDAVASGLGELGAWITRYHTLSLSLGHDQQALQELGELQHQLEAHNGWQFQQRVEMTLSRLGLPSEEKISALSGGWKRRVDLARALVIDPEVLLLDEPTNHLDFESIGWLEQQIANFSGAVLFVTHDRSFLQNLATRIVDLDRGKLVSWPGSYNDYLTRKAAALEEETQQNNLFDKKLAEEEAWIRQGIKARRTRNEGRVRMLEKLRKERAQRRNVQGNSKLSLERGESSGKKVIEINDISFAYSDRSVVSHFSALIQRGDKIGLIGANGAGKSTLLKLLLKELTPDSGTVEQGTRLEIAYFDQLREQLDPEITVADAVADGNDYVDIGGNRRHVMSYLADFLFAPNRARSPIKSLSGGEKSRLLLARLFTRACNLIVMDEPTNDLDLETLELLEERLVAFDGTVLLVSHDRVFLDNVVTSVFVLDGSGEIDEFVGGYSDWFKHCQQTKRIAEVKTVNREKNTTVSKASESRKKLSFREQQELSKLPELIESMESQLADWHQQINAPEFYKQEQSTVADTLNTVKRLESELEHAYQRWDQLEAQSK